MRGWRDSVGVRSSRSGLKSECVDIFSSEPDLWLLRHTNVVLMSCRVNSTITIAVFCLQNLICLHYYFC